MFEVRYSLVFGELLSINNLSVSELIQLYSDILEEFKNREVIRTSNLVGDLGEYIAIEYFNNNPRRVSTLFSELSQNGFNRINQLSNIRIILPS